MLIKRLFHKGQPFAFGIILDLGNKIEFYLR
jgi:hypothetical protein